MSKNVDSTFERYFTYISENWNMFENCSNDIACEIEPGQSRIMADFKNPPGDFFQRSPQNEQFPGMFFTFYNLKISKRYVSIENLY